MDYLIHLAIFIAIYSIMAISLNMIVGYTGLFSVTHAAFYGLGAYATAILMTKFGANFFLSMIAGVLVTFMVSLLLGMVLSKFSEDYYAIVSIGISVIAYTVYLNWLWLTNGPIGFPGIGRPAALDFE
ncbi:MAG: branched-chain amino acid ABC transporter permease, partial [Nitrospirota bacterium]